jgi:hypothetical protein
MSFNGKVDNVTYDIKDMPTVNINGVSYFIGAFYNFNHNIKVGDSLVKIKGDYKFKLIKKSSGEIFYYSQ